MKTIYPILIACAFASLSASAFSAEETAARDAGKRDPARWSEPADTPRLKFENMKKEVAAALAEALAECRAQGSDRKACEAQARAQYRRDLEAARGPLSSPAQR